MTTCQTLPRLMGISDTFAIFTDQEMYKPSRIFPLPTTKVWSMSQMADDPTFSEALAELVDMIIQRIQAGITIKGRILHDYISHMVADLESYLEFENLVRDHQSFREKWREVLWALNHWQQFLRIQIRPKRFFEELLDKYQELCQTRRRRKRIK